jgi:EmrB/QacA subfamily drug resistance transporter
MPTQTPEQIHERRWWILAVLCLSLLIVFIGNSSLNVTLPTLSRQLHATESQLQWLVAIYSLVFAGLLFTTGALGDRFGRKGALQLGLLIFLCGAGLASTASAMPELIGCRALMGVGAAFIMPSTLSILINVFPPHERTKAIAIWASVTGAAGGFGPVISGLLLAHFWWGAVFLINVPLLFLALVAGYFLVPTSRDPEKAPLDPVGAVLSTVGVVSMVYGLIQAPQNGWGSPATLGAFALGVVLLVTFGLWERRKDEPMLDISYFKNPAFSTGTGGMVLVFMAMYGVMFLITQYFQLVLNYSALSASLRLMPLALIMLIVAPLTPRISAALGTNRTVAIGMSLVALGLILFRGLTPHTPYWYVVVAIIPLTTGIAMTMAPMTAAIMSAVPLRRAGSGSAMNDATRELGAALGIAVLGSVAASRYANALHHATDHLTPAQQSASKGSLAGAQATAATLRPAADKALTTAANHAFVDGVHLAVTVGAIMALFAAACVLKWLPRQLAHQGEGDTPEESLEVTAEFALAGGFPITAEELDRDSDELARHGGPPETTEIETAELEADPAR